MTVRLDAQAPNGPIETRWSRHKAAIKMVAPSNRRKHEIIVVGSGLAGAAAAASLGEMGYQVKCFCFQDSPRRAHSIAAQGGINSAKNYQNDNDSIWRLFYDTIKGGDFRAREANVYRLAEVSLDIIDQAVAQGVPFAREYGGHLANRSFGGAQVSRTFYARGQTGQQLLLGAYQALSRQIDIGTVRMFSRTEMLDLIRIDQKARGIVTRDLVTGRLEAHVADCVVLGTGGYGNVFYLSTNAKGSNCTAILRAYRHGALFANPCYTQIHPTCIPQSGEYQSKLTLMSESLRNDGRVWVPKSPEDCDKDPRLIQEEARDYFLERKYPAFGNLVPRDIASRAAKAVCDEGRGVGPLINGQRRGVYLDFADALRRLGHTAVEERYGNLFQMYERITGEDPYEVPMRIYPAVHYTMGGLWVDYNLMTTVEGLFSIGEANFSDHGANRLGASALMQGLADGYFILPYTLPNYLASSELRPVAEDHPEAQRALQEVQAGIHKLMSAPSPKYGPDWFHRKLGHILWEHCGMGRTATGLRQALKEIPTLRDQFWSEIKITTDPQHINPTLEKAGRVADFLELAELMCIDALHREESCGGHFREEHQSPEGEAKRNDASFSYVAAWQYSGNLAYPTLHREPLAFESVTPSKRSYK